jgi:hypothetical protein
LIVVNTVYKWQCVSFMEGQDYFFYKVYNVGCRWGLGGWGNVVFITPMGHNKNEVPYEHGAPLGHSQVLSTFSAHLWATPLGHSQVLSTPLGHRQVLSTPLGHRQVLSTPLGHIQVLSTLLGHTSGIIL